MPNTTNFNWPTPADTDLVKDGAAAIRNLGNGIDTSLIDLKGGTTGQILSKASNADMDFTFITPNVGDITEVQAGTGISVASGTGPVPVITNTVATAFDAAGDLIYGTGADTFTKLSLGTAGQFLKVNSGATAPEWTAAPSVGTWSQAATGSLTGASVTVSGLSGKEYYVFFLDFSHNSGASEYIQLQLNGDTGNNYYDFGNATGISALLPCGNTTVAGNTERNGGFYIGMADTAMVYKPVLSLPPVSGSIGGQQGGWYGSSSAITEMKFFMSGGSFDAGTYYVWSRG